MLGAILTVLLGCEVQEDDASLDQNQTDLAGWEINEANTGLRGDYSELSELNLNGGDAGKGTISYGTLLVNKGVTISYRIIRQGLDLSAGDITIDHCLIKPTGIGLGIPIVRGGNATILDSEIDGSSIPDSQVYYSFLVSSFTGVIKRCNIHGASSGIWINNNSATQAIAENNYVHGLKYVSGTDSHVDGITVRRSSGSGGVLVRNNRIVSEPSKSNTGPCFIKAWEGFVDNVLIEGNLFQGYGYSIILEASGHGYGSNMRCINNRIDPWNGWTTYVLGGNGWFEWNENYRYYSSDQDCKGAIVNKP